MSTQRFFHVAEDALCEDLDFISASPQSEKDNHFLKCTFFAPDDICGLAQPPTSSAKPLMSTSDRHRSVRFSSLS